jgi:hypothetical protein
MNTYTVTIREEGYEGSFVFEGVLAASIDEACKEGMENYQLFTDENVGNLTASAELTRTA